MKIPNFTAQASLYKTSNHYRAPAFDVSSQITGVMPQLGGKGFKGMAGCIMDCQDRNPRMSRYACRKQCSDPWAGADLSTPGNWLNEFLSSAGIKAWEIGCSANPFSPPGACAFAADAMRRES